MWQSHESDAGAETLMPTPLWVPAGISAASSIIGGLLGRSGQKSANKQNIALAREQMAFQERMSNTAYQRATEDLKKSNLNRILALGSPASSPQGARPNIQNPNTLLAAGVGAAGPAAVNSAAQAMAMRGTVQTISQSKHQEKLLDAQLKVAKETVKLVQKNTDLKSAAAKISRALADLLDVGAAQIKTMVKDGTFENWMKSMEMNVQQLMETMPTGQDVGHLATELRNLWIRLNTFGIVRPGEEK